MQFEEDLHKQLLMTICTEEENVKYVKCWIFQSGCRVALSIWGNTSGPYYVRRCSDDITVNLEFLLLQSTLNSRDTTAWWRAKGGGRGCREDDRLPARPLSGWRGRVIAGPPRFHLPFLPPAPVRGVQQPSAAGGGRNGTSTWSRPAPRLPALGPGALGACVGPGPAWARRRAP